VSVFQRWDSALALYDYRARYHPALGRFLSADTVVPEPGNPQALNRYAYVLNNPLKYTDPSGQWEQTIFDDFYLESLYSKSRGYALVKGRHTDTGKYNCNISNADVAARLVAGAGASSALILAHGTGRESGWYYSPEGYTLSNIPDQWEKAGTAPADLMVFNLNYSHEGWDDVDNLPLH